VAGETLGDADEHETARRAGGHVSRATEAFDVSATIEADDAAGVELRVHESIAERGEADRVVLRT
jgi:hypothetical protein